MVIVLKSKFGFITKSTESNAENIIVFTYSRLGPTMFQYSSLYKEETGEKNTVLLNTDMNKVGYSKQGE